MIPEVGKVPGVGLQERVMSIRRRRTHGVAGLRRRRTHSAAGLEHGWVATELGQRNTRIRDGHCSVAEYLPHGPWV